MTNKPTADVAEKTLLACILCDPRTINIVADIVQPCDFLGKRNQSVYEAMLELDGDGDAIDFASIYAKVEQHFMADQVSDLSEMIPDTRNAEMLARIVKEASILRGVQALSAQLIADSRANDANAMEILAKAESELFNLTDRHTKTAWRLASDTALDNCEGLRQALDGKGRFMDNIPTGFKSLDRYVDGFRPGDLVFLAARPSQGKTALALSMAHRMAKSGVRVGFFSLEMGADQVAMRLMSSASGIPLQLLRSCNVRNKMAEIEESVRQLRKDTLFIDDGGRLTPMEARLKLRRLQKEQGLDIAFIDYIGLMNWHERMDSKYTELTEISRSLKAMAKEMKIPIVALSQLRRLPPGAKPQRPELSDLRDSGSLEQDADICIFIHRLEQYLLDQTPVEDQGKAEILIAKHRNGPTGMVKMAFTRDLCSFEDLAQQLYPA